MRNTTTVTRPTPTRRRRPEHAKPKHVAQPQPEAGTVPIHAEELGHKGRSWRGR